VLGESFRPTIRNPESWIRSPHSAVRLSPSLPSTSAPMLLCRLLNPSIPEFAIPQFVLAFRHFSTNLSITAPTARSLSTKRSYPLSRW
jgi:hypothetical protein